MKVWILVEEEPASEFPNCCLGVYATKELAEEALKNRREEQIEDDHTPYGTGKDEDEIDWDIDWYIEEHEVQVV